MELFELRQTPPVLVESKIAAPGHQPALGRHVVHQQQCRHRFAANSAKPCESRRHIACSPPLVRSSLGFLLLIATACSPAQRATAGVGLGVVGAGATYVALGAMTSSCRERSASTRACIAESQHLSPTIGFPVAFAGLGAIVLGGLILATATKPHPQPPATTTDQPSLPAPLADLDKSRAAAMAIAELLLVGLDPTKSPPPLRATDDTQATLHVTDHRAVLTNLRIRTAADKTWQTITACYEYRNEWQLKSLGKSPDCARW